MTAPFHFRKIPTQVRGKLLFLSMYTRGLALLLKQSCDDFGCIELDGKEPADAIARLCAATPNERRRLPADIDELIRIGYLRKEHDALVVVEQETDWEQIDSSRGSRPRSARGQHASSTTSSRRHSGASTTSQNLRPELSPGNHSVEFDRREEKRREEDKKRPEGVQGEQAPRTDPTPTLRKQNLDEAFEKASSFRNQEANSPDKNPTQGAPVPSPPSPRHGPSVTVVGSNPILGQVPPAMANPGPTLTLMDLGTPTTAKPKRGVAKKSVKVAPQETPLPADWVPTEEHYAFGRELGLQKKHVDYFAGEMRDRAAELGTLSANWNLKFRNWMRKGVEFRKGVPPVVPEPLPPKQIMPPCPPPPPEVLAGAERARLRMEAGEEVDWRTMYKPRFVLPTLEESSPE